MLLLYPILVRTATPFSFNNILKEFPRVVFRRPTILASPSPPPPRHIVRQSHVRMCETWTDMDKSLWTVLKGKWQAAHRSFGGMLTLVGPFQTGGIFLMVLASQKWPTLISGVISRALGFLCNPRVTSEGCQPGVEQTTAPASQLWAGRKRRRSGPVNRKKLLTALAPDGLVSN